MCRHRPDRPLCGRRSDRHHQPRLRPATGATNPAVQMWQGSSRGVIGAADVSRTRFSSTGMVGAADVSRTMFSSESMTEGGMAAMAVVLV